MMGCAGSGRQGQGVSQVCKHRAFPARQLPPSSALQPAPPAFPGSQLDPGAKQGNPSRRDCPSPDRGNEPGAKPEPDQKMRSREEHCCGRDSVADIQRPPLRTNLFSGPLRGLTVLQAVGMTENARRHLSGLPRAPQGHPRAGAPPHSLAASHFAALSGPSGQEPDPKREGMEVAGTVECLQTRFSALSIPAQPPPREPVQREPFTPLLGRAPFLGDCNAAAEGRAAT